jgi:transcriptional regulator with XRE-family HTH domain
MPRRPPSFVQIVKREMRRQKVTAYALAKAAGVDISALYRWLRGERELGETKMSLILDALGLEVRPKTCSKTRKKK